MVKLKVMFAVLLILLVVIFGEVGYLITLRNLAANLKEKKTPPAVSLLQKRIDCEDLLKKDPWLQKIDKSLTNSGGKPEIKLYFQTEIEGKISKIDHSKEAEGYMLELVNNTNKKIIGSFTADQNIKKIQIFFADNKTAAFSDFKVGDLVRWKIKENVKDSNDRESTIFIKNR